MVVRNIALYDWKLHLDIMPKPDHMARKKVYFCFSYNSMDLFFLCAIDVI